MSNRKICVSICAETADEVIRRVKRAEASADIIEIRFDCLNENELARFRNLPASGKAEIGTFRPKEQGGKRYISKDERLEFWSSGKEFDWVDFELDLFESDLEKNYQTKICSYHDFDGVPENLDEIYDRLKKTDADVLKIAVRADDIGDTIEIWKLLEKARADNKKIVPIAMGEAGKWTRILGLAHGAPLAYAASDAGEETAPGQITTRELIDVYRVKELNENTGIYGIVGDPVAHSLSPQMHNRALRFHGLNAVYIGFAVKNLEVFIEKFIKTASREVCLNFKGFSVTSPHKQAIIKYLDEIDATAQAIGAVNTVKIENGKLLGFNTDADGFIAPLKNAYGDLRHVRVAVLGAGGAARAAIYALKKESANATIFARDSRKAESLARGFEVKLKRLSEARNQKPETDFNAFDIVVNCTPLGTVGALENETPVVAAQIERVKLVYDLVYNPFETRFMSEAGKVNVPTIGGLAMLVAQGMKQFEIWTGKPAPMKEMGAAALRKLK